MLGERTMCARLAGIRRESRSHESGTLGSQGTRGSPTTPCATISSRMLLVAMAWGSHPFPSRTRPLSPTARMVLLVDPVGEYVAASFIYRQSPSQ